MIHRNHNKLMVRNKFKHNEIAVTCAPTLILRTKIDIS